MKNKDSGSWKVTSFLMSEHKTVSLETLESGCFSNVHLYTVIVGECSRRAELSYYCI